MKNLNTTGKGMKVLSHEEQMAVIGGDDIIPTLKCISATMTGGNGGFRSFVLGLTIFGMARFCGVVTACANL